MKTCLITGGAGFIGSNFVKYVLVHTDCKVINLDLLTYAGNLENLASVEGDSRYEFVQGDIRDKKLLEELFSRFNIDTVVNFAAESHVDRSIEDPGVFLDVNAGGTLALLDVALHAWRLEDSKYCREYREDVRFLQVSTDEVYGTLSQLDPKFREVNSLMPNSPYSASKASADMLVRAYSETYGLPINITRCSNNYGPYQFPEKLIPLMINNAQQGASLPIYGDGLQIRDWLYVEDHCSAICAVLEKGAPGEVYNVGGNNEMTNIEIVHLILDELNQSYDLVEHIRDRPGHDRRYAIDNTKITSDLGWSPAHCFEEGIAQTIAWYRANDTWMHHVTSGAYREYVKGMYSC